MVEGTQFQGGDMTTHCRISRSDAGVGGGRKRHMYHLPCQNPGVTRPKQLFLRPYGDSRGADHYSVLEAVSEASAQVRGAKGPGSPKSSPTQSIDAPSGNLDRE